MFARSLDDIDELSQPLLTIDRAVPLDRTDYKGHMNEARCLQAFGDASDRVMLMLGVDPDYVAQGDSFFTAETHIRHLDAARAGQRIAVTTQMLRGDGRKMHLFHRMQAGGRLLATWEHMLIHVSLDTRKASAPGPAVAKVWRAWPPPMPACPGPTVRVLRCGRGAAPCARVNRLRPATAASPRP